MEVMIGVDPHKGSHTATMLDSAERELTRITVRAGCRQVEQLLEWADGYTARTWAVEAVGGMGYLLSQQLVAVGETVLDVPATSFIDTGICDPCPAAIMLIGFNEALHVSATQSGLTEAEIRALLDEEDPSGVLVRVTYTQTGQFIVEEASGVTYTGRFTSWFGGNVNGHTAEFGGTFSVRGTGDDGSRVTGNMTSHVTFVGGEPVVEFDKGHIRGCAA
jgi:hypothetical protein